MIIKRYLLKETFQGMLVITAVLLMIFISNQFVRYLGDAAIGRMTAQSVLQMMAIQVPLLSGFMLPLGYYLGVLLSYGRLHAESEMIMLFAGGMSRLQLVKITLLGASVVALAVMALMFWVEPKMAWYRDHILAKAAAASPLQKMAPGRFQIVGGRYVIYAEKMSRDHEQMENIFAAELPTNDVSSGPKNWSVMTAASGQQKTDAKSGKQYIEFKDGMRYIGKPGKAEFQIASFGTNGMEIPTYRVHLGRLEEFLPTLTLWRERKENPLAAAELQWRLSMPLSVLILGLLAVPLSQVKPRQGRYGRLIPAVITYILYIDLLFVSQSWVQKGLVSSGIGMWWVHVMMGLIAAVLLSHYLGIWRRLSVGRWISFQENTA